MQNMSYSSGVSQALQMIFLAMFGALDESLASCM